MNLKTFSSRILGGGILIVVLCIAGLQRAEAQRYHYQKYLEYKIAGWRDSAFREAQAGEKAGEPDCARELITCYLYEYGTPRNVQRALQLIDKWYTKDESTCACALQAHTGIFTYANLFGGKGECFPASDIQGVKFARALLKYWPKGGNQLEPYEKVVSAYLAECALTGKGGVQKDLAKAISYNPADKSYNSNHMNKALSYLESTTLEELGAALNRFKQLGIYDKLIDGHYDDISRWKSWEKFIETNQIENEKMLPTGSGIERLKSIYSTADANLKLAIEYAYIRSSFYVWGSTLEQRIAWLPDATIKTAWTTARISQDMDYESFKNLYVDPHNTYKALVDSVLLAKSFPELAKRCDEELTAQREAEAAALRAAEEEKARKMQELAEGYQSVLTQGFNTLTAIFGATGAKFWGIEIVLDNNGAKLDPYFSGNKETRVNAMKPFFPFNTYKIVSGPDFSEDGACTYQCEISHTKGKKKNQTTTTYRIKVYFTSGVIDVKRTFDISNAVKVE